MHISPFCLKLIAGLLTADLAALYKIVEPVHSDDLPNDVGKIAILGGRCNRQGQYVENSISV